MLENQVAKSINEYEAEISALQPPYQNKYREELRNVALLTAEDVYADYYRDLTNAWIGQSSPGIVQNEFQHYLMECWWVLKTGYMREAGQNTHLTTFWVRKRSIEVPFVTRVSSQFGALLGFALLPILLSLFVLTLSQRFGLGAAAVIISLVVAIALDWWINSEYIGLVQNRNEDALDSMNSWSMPIVSSICRGIYLYFPIVLVMRMNLPSTNDSSIRGELDVN